MLEDLLCVAAVGEMGRTEPSFISARLISVGSDFDAGLIIQPTIMPRIRQVVAMMGVFTTEPYQGDEAGATLRCGRGLTTCSIPGW
jgi:hypothetical protein